MPIQVAAGWMLISVTSIVYIYYTSWVIILPFVDKDQFIHNYFPDHRYALGLPLLAGVIGLMSIDKGCLCCLHTKDKNLNLNDINRLDPWE